MLSTQPDPIPPPPVTNNTYKYIPLYLFTKGRGEGRRWTSEKVRGALVHKRGRKYQQDWLNLQSKRLYLTLYSYLVHKTKLSPIIRTSTATPSTPRAEREVWPRSKLAVWVGSSRQPLASSMMFRDTRYREIPAQFRAYMYKATFRSKYTALHFEPECYVKKAVKEHIRRHIIHN